MSENGKSFGTSVYTGIAEDIPMPVIRTGKTNIEDVPDINDCARCDGTGLDPDGPGNGMYGTAWCRRCAGTGSREDGPT